MDAKFFYDLVGTYGLIAIFILAALEGDITLLLAGVLAHSGFFGEWSFVAVVAAGTTGAVVSDHIAYLLGHGVHSGAGNYRFYRHVRPRVERLSENFGASAMLLSKYIWGLRSALCMFYGAVAYALPKIPAVVIGGLFHLGFDVERDGIFLQQCG